ncbi:MAG: hypothetical protein LC620_05980, partial [Halobacteriales archaeon]|nr:hypothetical protein [Halobacteriales archaeon]
LEGAARRPILRPVLGLDKNDIIRLAKEWGSYETSVGPELCDLLGPAHPATSSRMDLVAAAESRIGLTENLPAVQTIGL